MNADGEVGPIGAKRKNPMRIYRAIGLVGVGLLIFGWVLMTREIKLFDQWYVEWIEGPFLWMMGWTLTIVWAAGRLAHMLDREDHRDATVAFEAPAKDRPELPRAS
jgi:hypothetical protein